MASNIGIRHRHSTLAFNIGIQHWYPALAFNIGILHWHSTLAFNINRRAVALRTGRTAVALQTGCRRGVSTSLVTTQHFHGPVVLATVAVAAGARLVTSRRGLPRAGNAVPGVQECSERSGRSERSARAEQCSERKSRCSFFSNSPNGYAHQNCTAILCKGVPSV